MTFFQSETVSQGGDGFILCSFVPKQPKCSPFSLSKEPTNSVTSSETIIGKQKTTLELGETGVQSMDGCESGKIGMFLFFL